MFSFDCFDFVDLFLLGLVLFVVIDDVDFVERASELTTVRRCGFDDDDGDADRKDRVDDAGDEIFSLK